jgi:Flp pilus assembly protein TadG
VKSAGSTRQPRKGQVLLEFALVLPLMFLLIVNVVNFGGMLYAWVTVSNAARTGAQYLMMGGATVHATAPPTLSQVSALITADLISLPNRASAVVQVCTNNNGEIVCSPSGGTLPSIPNDPENTLGAQGIYVLGTVDVTYTYKPFISFWSFPGLGINLTLPPTAIHRQAVMRLAHP